MTTGHTATPTTAHMCIANKDNTTNNHVVLNKGIYVFWFKTVSMNVLFMGLKQIKNTGSKRKNGPKTNKKITDLRI